MNKKNILITIFFLVIILIFCQKIKRGNDKVDKLYNLNFTLSSNYKTQQNFKKNINSIFINDTVYCSIEDNLQNKINEAKGKTLILEKGTHQSCFLNIPSNIKIIIPKNSTIKLADDCVVNQSSYGDAVGDALIKIEGSKNKFLENIFIQLDGKIDGNKSKHPYKKGGIEGINLKWVKNSFIYGSGSVINANGDGLDIDASNNCYIEGISFINNDGSGIHLGSPRPIQSSFNNLIIGCYAESNGFIHKRSGFDQSWPNIDGVTYFNCQSKNNYQNWDIQGSGGVVLNSDPLNKSSAIISDNILFENHFYEINNDLPFLNEYVINETGYYLFSFINRFDSLSIPTINGIEINDFNIVSKNDKYNISSGIHFFYQNDVLEFPSKNNNNTSADIQTMKLDLILPLNDIYTKKYKFKIFSWKIKSEINKFIYSIYSFFFDI